eukprot:6213654-Pleurochrysis_carterae.AAC.3
MCALHIDFHTCPTTRRPSWRVRYRQTLSYTERRVLGALTCAHRVPHALESLPRARSHRFLHIFLHRTACPAVLARLLAYLLTRLPCSNLFIQPVAASPACPPAELQTYLLALPPASPAAS